GITYPVAVDNDEAIWNGFHNSYWPAHYFIDGQGRIRAHHFGEGDYGGSERIIRRLLAENGATGLGGGLADAKGAGAMAPADIQDQLSPETYLGYGKAAGNINGHGLVHDKRTDYSPVAPATRNHWSYDDVWTVGAEHAVSGVPEAGIVYRFHARDLHMVLGPGPGGKPVRFRVRLDDKPPGADAGADVAGDGTGAVTSQRLYQLVRQKGPVKDRTFWIEFLDPGVEAFAFTFG
ncbi:MAG: cytochrome c biogenesis protein DipZ, partial [Proteobacteria bacterium]|nr:cytochrome c biogenesis protein DipZ [Pseudomonadota bacterium]